MDAFLQPETTSEMRRSAIGFWERGRIIYLALQIFPAFIGYAGNGPAGNDNPQIPAHLVGLLFLLFFIGSNIIYSLAYALEFLVLTTRFYRPFMRFRVVILIFGCALGLIVAFLGGAEIALTTTPRTLQDEGTAANRNIPTTLTTRATPGGKERRSPNDEIHSAILTKKTNNSVLPTGMNSTTTTSNRLNRPAAD